MLRTSHCVCEGMGVWWFAVVWAERVCGSAEMPPGLQAHVCRPAPAEGTRAHLAKVCKEGERLDSILPTDAFCRHALQVQLVVVRRLGSLAQPLMQLGLCRARHGRPCQAADADALERNSPLQRRNAQATSPAAAARLPSL